jgi:hypothetical protein
LEQSLNTLLEVPSFQAPWTDKMILTAGLPSLNYSEAWNLELRRAQSAEETENTFTFGSVSGETWHDIVVENGQRFQDWLIRIGFYQAKCKLMILDTTDPSAILPVLLLRNTENLVIFAVTADASSNSIEQNASYVTLAHVEKQRMPIITCAKSLIENFPLYIEDIDLRVNTDALTEVIHLLAGFMEDLIDVVNRDLKLGVWSHRLSACFSASDIVYSNPGIVLSLQQENLEDLKREDILTSYLFGKANEEQQEGLAAAFFKQFSDKKKRLLNKGVRFSEKKSLYKLYDLLVLLGVKELNYSDIEAGYQLVASRNSDLGVKTDDENPV